MFVFCVQRPLNIPARITQLHVLPHKLCPCAHHLAACLTAHTLSPRASLSCMSYCAYFAPACITQLHALPSKLCPCAHHSAACLTAQTLSLCTSLSCIPIVPLCASLSCMSNHTHFAPAHITQLHVLPRKLCPCAHHSAACFTAQTLPLRASLSCIPIVPLRTSLSCMSYRANFVPARIAQLHVSPHKLCPCAHHSAACLTAQTLSLRTSLSCMSYRANFAPVHITLLHVLPHKRCPCAHHSAAFLPR